MFLVILFNPEYITINSVPHWLDDNAPSCRPLTFGTLCRSQAKLRNSLPKASITVATCFERPYLCFDGTNENETLDTFDVSNDGSADHGIPGNTEKHPTKVHFTSLGPENTNPKGVTPTHQPTFQNPFLSTPIDYRRASDSSSSSETVRPGAFAQHRDTFWRLFEACRANDDQNNDNATPVRASRSVFCNSQLFGHRDTIARLHFKQNITMSLPGHILEKIAAYLSRGDYKNMRLTCYSWAEHMPHLQIGIAQRLPTEIVLKILGLLQLPEFDAARHTCRLWFMAGLDYKLATVMLRRSGLYSAHLHDIEEERLRFDRYNIDSNSVYAKFDNVCSDQIDREWLMSKRLATECRLSGY